MHTPKHEFNSKNVSKIKWRKLKTHFMFLFVRLNCTKLDELRICFLRFLRSNQARHYTNSYGVIFIRRY